MINFLYYDNDGDDDDDDGDGGGDDGDYDDGDDGDYDYNEYSRCAAYHGADATGEEHVRARTCLRRAVS